MDSSEEEEAHDISAFSKFDESIEVRNAEEIKSPVNSRPTTMKRAVTKNSGIKEKPNMVKIFFLILEEFLQIFFN